MSNSVQEYRSNIIEHIRKVSNLGVLKEIGILMEGQTDDTYSNTTSLQNQVAEAPIYFSGGDKKAMDELHNEENPHKDLDLLKQQLIVRILKIEDTFLLQQISDVLDASTKDIWEELSAWEQGEILKGLEEMERGETIDYEDFMRRHRA